MKLFCPNCGQLVPAGLVNVDTGLGRCDGCQNVFDVRKRLRDQELSDRKYTPALIPTPAQVRIEERGVDWQLRWRWFTPMYIALLIFCVAWDSFLIFWYSIAFGDGNAPWIMKVFPIGHVAVGVALTYAVLTGFLNSTVIEKIGSELRVSHGPLPWIGNRSLSIREIAQLYCDATAHYNENRMPSMTYSLHAILRDGRRVKLVGARGRDLVQFLECEIERRLGVKDQPVAGEMKSGVV